MKSIITDRGFIIIKHEKYQNERGVMIGLIQESSAIGDYEDALDKPGSSYLWVGADHRLNREEVKVLMSKMKYWLDKKRLPLD